jgi:hypothetical protein
MISSPMPDPYPPHMGGRASQVWPSSHVQHDAFRVIVMPPGQPPPQPPPTEAPAVQVEPEPEHTTTDDTTTTIVDATGALGLLGRWLVWFVLRIVVRRRRG